jgi:putative ABC transport system ATP-binding protein
VEVASLYKEPERDAERPLAALEFVDVFKIYRSGPVESVALRGLDLRVERGEFVAVLGPSGSGKSTFLHLAAGLDEPSAGEVRAFGEPLSRMDDRGLAEYRGRKLALVFQSDNLWPILTARENVVTAVRLSRQPSREAATNALELVGLTNRATHRPRALSGGEQQRAAIAAAAARRAPLVLADEPTGELDVQNERRVLDELRRLQQELGSTIVTVTHSPRLAAHADRVIEIRDGRVV